MATTFPFSGTSRYHSLIPSPYYWLDKARTNLWAHLSGAFLVRLTLATACRLWQYRDNRKPILLLRLFVLFLFRLATRQLSGLLLFQDPPRTTRMLKQLYPMLTKVGKNLLFPPFTIAKSYMPEPGV